LYCSEIQYDTKKIILRYRKLFFQFETSVPKLVRFLEMGRVGAFENGRVGEWERGSVGAWASWSVGAWERGRMRAWGSGSVGEWESWSVGELTCIRRVLEFLSSGAGFMIGELIGFYDILVTCFRIA
jgi:hypothetical protein